MIIKKTLTFHPTTTMKNPPQQPTFKFSLFPLGLVINILKSIFKNKANYFHYIIQSLLWLLFNCLVKLFLKFKVNGKENLDYLERPLLIATNHTSYFETILIYLSLPLHIKILPIRSIVWKASSKVTVVNLLLMAGGIIFVQKGIDFNKSLKQPLETLKNNGVVHIFFEYKKRCDGKAEQHKRDAPYLVINSNAQILPIKIKGTRKMTILDFIMGKKSAIVQIGKPFYLFQKTDSNITL